MNNNGARNAALANGRSIAKWVLPWDGNCFLTSEAWDDIVEAVRSRPYLKYFTVPMARILENDELLSPAPVVSPNEEPQLAFRRDAREQFNPDARYGRCPKVELLCRLAVPGPWHGWCRGPWDIVPAQTSPEAGHVGQAGWVARLASGQPEQEVNAGTRWRRRVEAIWECIDSVDEQLARATFQATALFALDNGVLERQRRHWLADEPRTGHVVTHLVSLAERSLGRPVGAAPGGHVVGGGALQSMIDETFVVALAGYFTRDGRFFARGAELLRDRFLSGRWSPPLWSSPAGPGQGHGNHEPAVIETTGFYYLLDAVRLLEREEALTRAEVDGLRAWFEAFRTWLRDSEPGNRARTSLDHSGTWYDVQCVSLGAYLNDVRGVLATLRRSHERVGQQFTPDGGQPEELASGEPWGRSALNLQGWMALAALAGRLGQGPWSWDNDQRLARAVQMTIGRPRGDGRPGAGGTGSERRLVLGFEAASHVPAAREATDSDPWLVEQLFSSDAGIRPFWILGSEAGDIA
jgi:hypothetical protein